ncbi:hypothetical protein C8R47DRAFT_1072892 [Mycena vitilis]|nr:hypothetical protein C8R47DRAFT_1072892 [Mycena vitilis]
MSEPVDVPIPRIIQRYRWSNPDGDPEDPESGEWEPETPPDRGLRHRRVEIIGENNTLIEHLNRYKHLVPNPLSQRNIELQLLSRQTATETVLALMEMSSREWQQLESFCKKFHSDPGNKMPPTNYEEMWNDVRAGDSQENYFKRQMEKMCKKLRAKALPEMPWLADYEEHWPLLVTWDRTQPNIKVFLHDPL